jgi:hypothetical protein
VAGTEDGPPAQSGSCVGRQGGYQPLQPSGGSLLGGQRLAGRPHRPCLSRGRPVRLGQSTHPLYPVPPGPLQLPLERKVPLARKFQIFLIFGPVRLGQSMHTLYAVPHVPSSFLWQESIMKSCLFVGPVRFGQPTHPLYHEPPVSLQHLPARTQIKSPFIVGMCDLDTLGTFCTPSPHFLKLPDAKIQ